MDLDHLPWFATFKLYTFILSQRADLVKIHLFALTTISVLEVDISGAGDGAVAKRVSCKSEFGQQTDSKTEFFSLTQ